ncbi:MAG: chemotaxis protein CheW [Anaerolineae bacterium]|nr:chemotaxis protein CheW [Anaerolineae bacterium]
MGDPTNINWETVWRDLAWEDSADSERAVTERLRQRARQYAAPKTDMGERAGQWALAFTLGEERYAVDVMAVRSVRTISHITRVPGVPSFYRGVVNVRGQVITVLDLRIFFDMAVPAEDAEYELIVIDTAQLILGLLAHHIEGVVMISPSELEGGDHIRYAAGVTAERLVLLDVGRLFEDQRLVIGGKDEN